MTGQLKKGEKACAHVCTHPHTQVRMMVNKELPKLLEKLRDAVHEYETTLGLQLKVEGQRIIDVLDAADESSEAAKHEAQVCVCVCVCTCMCVCMYTCYMHVERLPRMIQVNRMCQGVNTHVCMHVRMHTHTHTHTHVHTNRHARWRNR